MKRRVRILLRVGLPIAAVTAFVLYTLAKGGAFTRITPHGPRPLRVVEGFAGGTEDAVFRPDRRQLFVSSADFRDPSRRGHIYLVDVAAGGAPRDVTPKLDFPLAPHGIDLYVGPDGSERLFVVNHRGGSGFTPAAGDISRMEHTIEVFDVKRDGSLVHVTTYRGSALISPNDVAAVAPDRFYFTNDHGYRRRFARSAEDWLRIPAGGVMYFDGESYREVFHGCRYANGIAATPDGKTLYVAETTGAVLRRFKRDPATGALTPDGESDGHIGIDNVSIDADGAVWTAGHPKLLAFVEHAKDPRKRSPSQVLRFIPAAHGAWQVDEFYLDDGSTMSGSSIAAANGDNVVVGAVFQSKLLVLPRSGKR